MRQGTPQGAPQGFIKALKWLYPGMKVKRWILLASGGLVLVGLGSVKSLSHEGALVTAAGLVALLVGVGLVVTGMQQMVRSVLTVVRPARQSDLVDLVYRKRHLERGPRIAAIGGGTGLPVLLQGLKDYTSNITAIVTMSDDGGSSGRLRDELGTLPPGDLRNCLVALADAEPLMRDLFQFRFDQGSGLQGHNFGNLFITAMSKVSGDFEQAIRESSKVLAIRGRVVPSTVEKVVLVAEHEDGTETIGETSIAKKGSPIRQVALRPRECRPTVGALQAIREADAIVLGPGSLYTSVIPNLLIPGMSDAIAESKALKLYVCNVMTQAGETDRVSAAEHVRAIVQHSRPGLLDYCIVNRAPVPEVLLQRYQQEHKHPVLVDTARIEQLGCTVIEDEVISVRDYVRHDPARLARIVMDVVMYARGRW